MVIAEAICRSEIAVVTGIGHQRDDTLADQVADMSQITPTAAALFLARASQPPEAIELPKTKPRAINISIMLLIVASLIILVLALMLLGRSV